MNQYLGFSGADTFNVKELSVAYIHIVTFYFPLRYEHSQRRCGSIDIFVIYFMVDISIHVK